MKEGEDAGNVEDTFEFWYPKSSDLGFAFGRTAAARLFFSFVNSAKMSFSQCKQISQPWEEGMFPSPQPESPHPPPENTSW